MKFIYFALLMIIGSNAFALEFKLFGRSTGGATHTNFQQEGADKEAYFRILPDSWFTQSFGFDYKINPKVKGKLEFTIYRGTDSSVVEPVVKNFYFDINVGGGTLTIGTQPTLHTKVAYYHDILLAGHDAFRAWLAGPAYNGSLNAITYTKKHGGFRWGVSLVEAKSPGGADGTSTTDTEGNVSVTPKQTDSPALEVSLGYQVEVGGIAFNTAAAFHQEKMGIEEAGTADDLKKTEDAKVITGIVGASYGRGYLGATVSQGDPLVYWFGRRQFSHPGADSAIEVRKGLKDKYDAYAFNLSYDFGPASAAIYVGEEVGTVDGGGKDIGKTDGFQIIYPWEGIDWFLSSINTNIKKQDVQYVKINTTSLGADFKF